MFSDSYRSSIRLEPRSSLLILPKGCASVEHPEVINVCCDSVLSKCYAGLRITDKLGVSGDLVKPVRIAEHSVIFKTARASSMIMNNSIQKSVLDLLEAGLRF